MDPLVSIVVPVYNEERSIVFLLKSLLKQNFSHKFEIVIVNNDSTDNTVDVIKNFKKISKFEDLKIINSCGKLGKVRNDGVLNSIGKWIAFIDADEIADTNWLRELLTKAEVYDGVAGAIEISNPNKNSITKAMELLHTGRIKILKNQKKIKTIGTGNLLIHRKIFENGIYFDSNFPNAEDGDFTYRLYKKGFKIGFNSEAKIYHNVPETITQLSNYRKKSVLGKKLIFRKHSDLYSFFLLITEVFYWITPPFFKIFIFNKNIPKMKFFLFGIFIFLISFYYFLNPILSFKLRSNIIRQKY